MRFTFIVLMVCCFYPSFSQVKIYYKDASLTKEVAEKKASFLKSEFKNGDTLISQLSRLSDNLIIRQKKWINDRPVGVWFEYALDGQLVSQRNFNAVTYEKELPKIYNNAIDTISCKTCQPAVFGTGAADLNRYLLMNLQIPIESRMLGSKGRVFICFILTKGGEAQPYTILRGVDPYIDFAAWELIRQMPAWSPAMKDGEPIESYYILPIKYLWN